MAGQPRRSRPAPPVRSAASARRDAVPRPAEAGTARLRAGAAPGPRGVRDLRHALAPARQRHPGLPCAQRRRPRGGLRERRRPTQSTRDGFAAEDRDGTAGKGLGWWDGMIGPGKAFDTDRFFVVSTNLLGGCRGTTGPSSIDPATGRPYGSDFPVITVADMVRTERAFLDELGIERLAAVAGGSLGGMQAFEWAILFPDQVDAVVAIASTHALHPQGVAWNAIAREAIMRDPAWQGGHYYGTGRAPDAGMGVARMVGHITYLSAPALERQVRPAAAVRRRHPLHDHRAGVRGRELPAPPGRLVRQALRRQHLPLHVARADLLRSRAAVRRRIARAGARRRLGADAADRVQLGLAVSAGGVAGDRGRRCARSASRSSST